MTIIVLIKQVPDMEKVKFDREKGRIDRTSAGTEINPFDLNALETAVRISEQTNSKVVALFMGPPQAEESLREAIARGADEGILLSDITGEHGIGKVRNEKLKLQLSEKELSLMKAIKNVFDPNNILNPGTVL